MILPEDPQGLRSHRAGISFLYGTGTRVCLSSLRPLPVGRVQLDELLSAAWIPFQAQWRVNAGLPLVPRGVVIGRCLGGSGKHLIPVVVPVEFSQVHSRHARVVPPLAAVLGTIAVGSQVDVFFQRAVVRGGYRLGLVVRFLYAGLSLRTVRCVAGAVEDHPLSDRDRWGGSRSFYCGCANCQQDGGTCDQGGD